MAKELKIRITGDSSGLKKATDDSVGILGDFGGKIGAWSVAAGTLIADGLKTGVKAVGGFIADSIGSASDMNETVSKVGVLFGDGAGQIEAFAATAATSLGQSKQQAMDAAATFAVFGKSAGLSGSDLATFSTDLTTLASDLASFSNTTPEDAINAIGSALRGEAEPMRAYGVLLDDASMRQKALEMGIISSTKDALTPQQKVLAAQALIMAQTADAQGDFARTSDGLANKQRIVAAQIDNLKSTMGQAFLPIVLSVTSALSTKLLPILEKFGPIVSQEIAGGIKAFVSAFKAMDGDVTSSGFPGVMERVGYAARLIFEGLKALWPTIKQVGTALFQAAGQVLAFYDRVVTAFQAGGIRAALGEALDGVKSLLIALGEWVGTTAVPWLVGKVVDLGRALGEWITGTAVPYLQQNLPIWLASLGEWITGTALPWLGEQGTALAEKLGGWLGEAAKYLLENLPGWLGSLTAWLVGTAIPTVIIEGNKLAMKLGGWVAEAGLELLRNLPGWLRTLYDWITNDAVPAMTRFGVDLAENLVSGIIRGLGEAAGRLLTFVGDFIKRNVTDRIKSALDVFSPSRVTMEIGEQVAAGLAIGMADGVNMVAAAADGMATAAVPSSMANYSPAPYTAVEASGGMVAGSVGPGGTVTINITTGADPQAVVTAIKTYIRQNGGTPW